MLGGGDPVIIFQFSKLADTAYGRLLAKIPLVSDIPTLVSQPPIPIYLSEEQTGIQIDSQSKAVDINTDFSTMSDGELAQVDQKGVSSLVSIALTAKRDSLFMVLLSSMIDLCFDKSTSKEYAITYLNGATTIFRGLLHSYVVDSNSDNELLSIKIELTKGDKQPVKGVEVPTVPGIVGALPGG